MSTLKVGFFMVAMMALISWVANMLGGPLWAIGALVVAIVMNVSMFWFSDTLVIKMTKAQPVSPAQAPELYEMVDRLSKRAQIPNPTLYIVQDPSPNAFATGRDPSRGVVAVNTGLLDLLDKKEIEGVIAHEIAHIKHRDTLTMAIVAALAGAVMMLALIARFAGMFMGGHDQDRPNPIVLLVVALLAPFAAMIIQMAISRAREYEADRLGAELAGRPDGLANALKKLEAGATRIPTHTFSESTAHLAIVNPFAGLGGIKSLFSTHPSTEDRIRRLMAMK